MTRKARILRFGPSHRGRRLLSEPPPEVGEDAGLLEAPAPAAIAPSVLITDENRDRAEALAAVMAGAGYRPLTATSGPAALDVFVRERSEAVLVDHGVLATGGPGFVRRVRALAPAVPIIVQTGALDAGAATALVADLDVDAIAACHREPARLVETVRTALAIAATFERLLAEQDLRGLILAKLCHALRSPLHVIQGYTDMLRQDPAAAGFDDVLERVAGATDSAIGQLQEYLDLARLEAPGLAVRREQVDVDELTGELTRLAERLIGDRPVRFAVSPATPCGFLLSDGAKLRAILTQLLINAVEFSPNGTVRLVVQSRAGRTEFAIADRGPGVDEEDLPILFVPFRQRRRELFASMPGQGLGLAIAKRLSSLIGASLTVRRRKAGHGTVFVLSLPSPLAVHTAQGAGRTLH